MRKQQALDEEDLSHGAIITAERGQYAARRGGRKSSPLDQNTRMQFLADMVAMRMVGWLRAQGHHAKHLRADCEPF